MDKTLAQEAANSAALAEKIHSHLKSVVDRKLEQWDVVQADGDNVRSDMVGLILNAKPDNLHEDDWFKVLEGRNGCKARTYRKWRNLEVKNPATHSCFATLHALGMDFYYGRRRR